jgi:hypothetical protein
MTTMTVWDAENDRTVEVSVAEARAGLGRYARSLGAGTPACGEWETTSIAPIVTPQETRAADELVASLPQPCPDCPGEVTALGSPNGRPLIQCGNCGGIFDAIIFASYRDEERP